MQHTPKLTFGDAKYISSPGLSMGIISFRIASFLSKYELAIVYNRTFLLWVDNNEKIVDKLK